MCRRAADHTQKHSQTDTPHPDTCTQLIHQRVCCPVRVCLGPWIISFVGGVWEPEMSACVCLHKGTRSQNPQFDQTRVEAIRSAPRVSSLIMFWTFVYRTADSYHQFTRERGQWKAICQPLLKLLSLSTKQHFSATAETVCVIPDS